MGKPIKFKRFLQCVQQCADITLRPHLAPTQKDILHLLGIHRQTVTDIIQGRHPHWVTAQSYGLEYDPNAFVSQRSNVHKALKGIELQRLQKASEQLSSAFLLSETQRIEDEYQRRDKLCPDTRARLARKRLHELFGPPHVSARATKAKAGEIIRQLNEDTQGHGND